MVNHGEIVSKLLKNKSFKNMKDINELIACCEAIPNSPVPHMLLNQYQPDIFKSSLWQISDEISAEYQEVFYHYSGKNIEEFIAKSGKKKSITDFNALALSFIQKFEEKRNEFYKKTNFFSQKSEKVIDKEAVEVDFEKENTATNLESKDLNPNNIQDFAAETEKNRLADTEARDLILKFLENRPESKF